MSGPIREQTIGTIFFLGVAAFGLSIYWLVNLLSGTLGTPVSWGLPPLVAALIAGMAMARRGDFGGPSTRFGLGCLALAGAGLVLGLGNSGGIFWALNALGCFAIWRGLVLLHRQSFAEGPTDERSQAAVALFAIWLVLAALLADPLAALRLAVLAILLRGSFIHVLRGWRRFSSWMRYLLTPRAEPAEEVTFAVHDDDLGVGRPRHEPDFTPDQARIAAAIKGYINAVYNVNPEAEKWPDPWIKRLFDSPAWEIFVVDKPPAVDSRPFLSKIGDLAIELGIEPESLVMNIGGVEGGIRIEIRKEKQRRRIAWFDDLEKEYATYVARRGSGQPEYEVALGLDAMNRPVMIDLADVTTPHVLIAGTSGSGKSSLMNVILVQLLARNSPDRFKVAIIDSKGTFARAYQHVPHLWSDVITDQTDREGIIGLFKTIYEEMNRRQKLWLEEIGVTSLAAWNARHPEQNLPVLLLAIDEAQDLGDSADEQIKNAYTQYVGEIARKGRSFGVLIMIGVQRPSLDNIGKFRGQLNRRIVLKLTDKNESALALQSDGDATATKLGGQGDGFLQDSDGRRRFAGAFLPDDDASARPYLAVYKRVAVLTDRWGGPRPAGTRVSGQSRREELTEALTAEHQRSIDNGGWLVVRAVEAAYMDAPEAWENDPADPPVTSEGLLTYVKRVTPEGFTPERPIDPAFITETLTRLTDDRPAKGGVWPFTRSAAAILAARFRRIDERSWYVMRGLQAFLAIPERTEKISPAAVMAAANRLLPTPLEPALSAREVEEILRHLVGNAPVDNLRGRGEAATAKAIADALVNNYGVVVEAAPAPPRPRPSVADIASRPAQDSF